MVLFLVGLNYRFVRRRIVISNTKCALGPPFCHAEKYLIINRLNGSMRAIQPSLSKLIFDIVGRAAPPISGRVCPAHARKAPVNCKLLSQSGPKILDRRPKCAIATFFAAAALEKRSSRG